MKAREFNTNRLLMEGVQTKKANKDYLIKNLYATVFKQSSSKLICLLITNTFECSRHVVWYVAANLQKRIFFC